MVENRRLDPLARTGVAFITDKPKPTLAHDHMTVANCREATPSSTTTEAPAEFTETPLMSVSIGVAELNRRSSKRVKIEIYAPAKHSIAQGGALGGSAAI